MTVDKPTYRADITEADPTTMAQHLQMDLRFCKMLVATIRKVAPPKTVLACFGERGEDCRVFVYTPVGSTPSFTVSMGRSHCFTGIIVTVANCVPLAIRESLGSSPREDSGDGIVVPLRRMPGEITKLIRATQETQERRGLLRRRR